MGSYGVLTGQQQDQPSRRSCGPDSCLTALVPFPGSRTRLCLDSPESTGSSSHFLWAHGSANGGGHVPLASLNPSIPISSRGRVQRTRVGPLASRLPPDTSGGRRTCRLILRLTSLSFQTSLLCLHLPTPLVLAALLVAVVGSRGRCCRVRGLPGVSTCGSSAAAKPSNARATSRDAEGALDCGYCVRLLGHAEPGRVGIIRPCAPYDPPRRIRSFPVGRSPSPVVGDHALSSEISLITLYRTYGTEMISTLADMINPYVSSQGRTTEDIAEPIHLISIATK